MQGKLLNLRDLDEAETIAALGAHGIPAAQALRVFTHVQRDGAASLDGLERFARLDADRLRPLLQWPDIRIAERRRSADGFVKYLFELPDGASVEAVRIPLPDAADARAARELRRQGLAKPLQELPTAKYSLCISSQVGCELGCAFCASGRLRARRDLATWEILAQHRLVAAEADHPIRGVVFMGMGEPLLNYDNVIKAARILCHPAGRAVGAKSISISTAGVAPGIQRFASEGHHFRLIVSLTAPTSDERRRLMPVENRWPLHELMDAVRAYAATTTQRVTIAYVMVSGVNTGAAQARELAQLLAGIKVRLNLIDVADPSGRYRPPTTEELVSFRRELGALGVPVVRRYSGGQDIGASCGNLALRRSGGTELPDGSC